MTNNLQITFLTKVLNYTILYTSNANYNYDPNFDRDQILQNED